MILLDTELHSDLVISSQLSTIFNFFACIELFISDFVVLVLSYYIVYTGFFNDAAEYMSLTESSDWDSMSHYFISLGEQGGNT